MSTVSVFEVKQTIKGKTRRYLNLRFTVSGERISESTGMYYIEPATTKSDREHNRGVKERLALLTARKQIELDQRGDDYVPARAQRKTSLLDVFDRYIAEKAKDVKPGTLRNIQQTRTQLSDFRDKITLADLNASLVREFIEFLRSKQSDGSMKQNTVARHINGFSAFCNYVRRKGYKNANPFDDLGRDERIRFNYDKKENAELRQKIFLTLDEVQAMWDARHILNDNAWTGKYDTHYAFLLSTMVGLRFSDVSRLAPEHIKYTTEKNRKIENGFIDIKQKKTDYQVQVPLNSAAVEILEEVKSRNPHYKKRGFFRTIAGGRKVNRLAFAAGIRTEEEVRGLVFNNSRHSFSQLLQDQGIAISLIDQLLGHKVNKLLILASNYSLNDFEEQPDPYIEAVNKISFLG